MFKGFCAKCPTILIAFLCFLQFSGVGLYNARADHANSGIVRSKGSPSTLFINDNLAPSTKFSPLYRIIKKDDGKLNVVFPSERPNYQDIVTAMLYYSIGKNVGVGPFNEFIEKVLGEKDFAETRIGTVIKKGTSYYALYRDRIQGLPEIRILKFTEVGKSVNMEKNEGVIIKLADGVRILMEVKDIDDQIRTYFEEEGVDVEVMSVTHKVVGLISNDNIDDAVREFCIKYLSSNEEENNFAVTMFNLLISAADKDNEVRGRIREFSKGVKQEIREVVMDPEALWSFQNIIGQAIVILSSVEEGIKGAGEMRITNDPNNMLQAGDKDRGQSFIEESSVPAGLGSADTEGMPGAYDRGYETFKKLGDNILENLVYGRARFEEALASKESFIMYRMVHGLVAVAKGIEKYTKKGLISTFHKTVFLRDFVSGSYQTTSTGPGHFQGLQLDVKQVTAGLGIQFNVKYNSKGEMVKVVAQYIKEGDFFYALPGCVDYMVNLGGLEFNDFSVKLSEEAAAKFNSDIDFKTEGVLESVSKQVSKKAPYIVGIIEKELLILNNMEEQVELEWIDEPDVAVLTTGRNFGLRSLYKAISSESNWRRFTGSDSKTEGIAYNAYKRTENEVGARFPIMSQDVVKGIMERTEEHLSAPSLLSFGKIGTMTYLEENSEFLSGLQKEVNTSPKLIRLPLEILAKMDKEDAVKLIEGIQQTAYGHVELYSSQEMITPDESVYLKYGVNKKDLPEGFLENRSNTITLIPVFQNNSIEAQDISIDKIGGIRAEDTIILPTGICHDMAGVARSVILGLRLAELSSGQIDGEFLDETLAQYRAFCEFYGIKDFDVNKSDLAALIIGNINDVVKAMNKLIKYMPIMPLNTEEIREIYEGVHEVLTRA